MARALRPRNGCATALPAARHSIRLDTRAIVAPLDRAKGTSMRRLIFEPEHDEFRASARRFFQNEIAPHAEKWREQGFVDRWAFTKAGEQGFLLMWAEEKYGA